MRRHHITLGLLVMAGTAFAVMQTLVIPALPFFRREFGTSQADTTWLVTGFLLSSSVLTPLLGKLGDMYGKKRVMVVCLVIFGGGSLAAAAGGSLAWLVACRVVQGAGAAVFPLAFGIIRDEFAAEQRGVAIGLMSSVFGMGGGLGLVGSGFVLDELSWQWLFVIGGAPVLGAAALIWAFVPESPVRRGGRPDFLGAAVFSAALVALLLAVTKGEQWGWFSLPVMSLFAASVLAGVAWIAIERRVPEPLVDLRTLAKPAMALTNAATVLVGFSLTAFFVLMPAFVQVTTFGYDASLTEAGLYFIPSAVAMIVCGPAAGWLGTRYGHAVALRIGLGASAVAFTGLDGPARRGDRLRPGRHRHARDRELARERDGGRERRQPDHAHGRRRGGSSGRGGRDLGGDAGGSARPPRGGLHDVVRSGRPGRDAGARAGVGAREPTPAASPAGAQPRLNVPIRRPRATACFLIAARTSSGLAPASRPSAARSA
jgi:MFS family permease